jgi:mono/diheme cytochrome c family protein
MTRLSTLVVAIALLGGWTLAAQQPKTSVKATARSQWSGVYSDAQANRGEPLYAENCAFCHGAALEGTISAPPLTASALSGRWQGRTLADLFDYQQAFMPWNSPGGFGRAQNVDILAYVFKKAGFPAGSDLPSQPDAQRQTTIVAAKP